jgi:protein-tyrosine phosphatase
MAAKRTARDLWWHVRGRGVQNPPLPAEVRSILFVCLGNICRSPFAELIAARQLDALGLAHIRCASAGIRATQAAAPPGDACAVARKFGISLAAHRPQLLTRDLVNAHDMVIVMEMAQLAQLRAAYPDAADRLFLMPLFEGDERSGYDGYNIADPFSLPRTAYEVCYRRLDRAVASLITAIQQTGR